MHVIPLILSLSTALACDASREPVPTTVVPAPEYQVTVLDGGQSVVAGRALAIAPGVQLVDANGKYVSGKIVSFKLTDGHGSITGDTVITGADGVARLETWTLGCDAGPNWLNVEVGASYPGGNAQHVVQIEAIGQAPSACSDWSVASPMPGPRSEFGVAVIDGILYLIGGRDSSHAYLATVDAYDPSTGQWRSRAPLNAARIDLGIGVINGMIYAVGGWESASLVTTVEAYNPATNTWTARAPLPEPEAEVGVGVVGGVLYAVGGARDSAGVIVRTAKVYGYDPATDTWTPRAPLSGIRDKVGVGGVNGILFAVGGLQGANETPGGGGFGGGDFGGGCSFICLRVGPFSDLVDSVDAYDPATDQWSSRAPLPSARVGAGIVVINGTIYAVGGDAGDGILSDVESFDPAMNRWKRVSQLSFARSDLGVAVINDTIYALGGLTDGTSNNTGVVETYRP